MIAVNRYVLLRDFVAVIRKNPRNSASYASHCAFDSAWQVLWLSYPACTAELFLKPAIGEDNLSSSIDDLQRRFVIGDDGEVGGGKDDGCLAGAAQITLGGERLCLSVRSSLIGLPPILLMRWRGALVIGSNLATIKSVTKERFQLEGAAVVEKFRIGHPINGKTLFRDVTLLPSAHLLDVDFAGNYSIERHWQPPIPLRLRASPNEHIPNLCSLFMKSLSSLQINDSFFSLTGGLDTRAILAGLASNGSIPPVATLSSGRTLSLDARAAQHLCRHYGVDFLPIQLGEDFEKSLPELTLEASRLSGGLSSIDQAHEVYYFRKACRLGNRRLCGNFGNQIGRVGLERLSMADTDLSIVNPDLANEAVRKKVRHWLVGECQSSPSHLFQAVIEHEVPYTSIGNFCIGAAYAIHQSPYANKKLLEAAYHAHAVGGITRFQPMRWRWRDLKHRFFGEPQRTSFQRTLIVSSGGCVANYPVNWGWVPSGGISLSGWCLGSAALLDAIASRPDSLGAPLRRGLELLNVRGIQEIVQLDDWCRGPMRSMILDVLGTKSHSAIFDNKNLQRLLNTFTQKKNCDIRTLVTAFDVALAAELFT